VRCGVFCFLEYTGCSCPCLLGLIIDVDVILLIICHVKYCVDSFTLLQLREFNVFSPQSFQSFLKLDFSVSRSAAAFLWLSLGKILCFCLSFLRGFSRENRFLFDFLMYFAAIVKDFQVLQTNTTKGICRIPFSKMKIK